LSSLPLCYEIAPNRNGAAAKKPHRQEELGESLRVSRWNGAAPTDELLGGLAFDGK